MPREVLSIDLKGAAELDRALGELGKQVATRIGRKAVKDPTDLLATVLRLTAPYLPGVHLKRGKNYGHLRENLKVKPLKAKKPGLILYRVSTGDAFWGNFLELGTVKMAAQPWMRPTVDGMKGEIVDLQISTLSLGITRAMKKRGPVNATGRNG